MTTRNVVSDGIQTPDGLPIANAKLGFILVDYTRKKAIPAFVVATGEMIRGAIFVDADSNGAFTVALTPNDQLSPQTTYLCRIVGTDNFFYAQLESGVTDKSFVDFYANGVTLTAGELEALRGPQGLPADDEMIVAYSVAL